MQNGLGDHSEKKRFPSSLQTRRGWAEYFEMKRSTEPHLHQIEPTNHCPYSCIMCPRSQHMKRELGFMDISLYQKVIDEVSTYSEPIRLKEIELFHFGESLLHPCIDKFVGYASEQKLKVTLSVNGPHLTPELSRKILEHQPFRIIVSLDGNDQETYQAIRGRKADFDKAVRNIDALADTFQRVKSATKISVRMIEIKINREQVYAFKKRWQDKNIEVEVRQFFPWGEKDMVELGNFEKYPPAMPCPFPWQYLVVQWNGDVVPCCRDYNAAITLGNVKNVSLKEIWNSGRYEEFRQQMASGKFHNNPICSPCLDLYYTEKND
ncbi:radical SAM protein [bacterium]|nr:MAG: radical SAM protein [bacterium]